MWKTVRRAWRTLAFLQLRLLVGPSYLTGLRQNDTDRSNVAFQNVGQGDAGNITLRLTVFSGSAANPVSRTLPDEILAPGGFRQISGILAYDGLSLDQGYVRVERVSGTAPYYAYAVINDQKSSDGSFIPPLVESSLVGRTRLTLPALVEANSYSTELIVTNWSSVRKALRCTFQSEAIQTAGSKVEFNIEANPGEQLIWPDFVQRLREVGVAGLPKGPSYAGAMFAEVSSGRYRGPFPFGPNISTSTERSRSLWSLLPGCAPGDGFSQQCLGFRIATRFQQSVQPGARQHG